MTTNCFPPGFPTRPPQAYAMVPAVHAGASFQHRSNLSAKNLQAFNAYQTHLYPDMYTDYRQGKIKFFCNYLPKAYYLNSLKLNLS